MIKFDAQHDNATFKSWVSRFINMERMLCHSISRVPNNFLISITNSWFGVFQVKFSNIGAGFRLQTFCPLSSISKTRFNSTVQTSQTHHCFFLILSWNFLNVNAFFLSFEIWKWFNHVCHTFAWISSSCSHPISAWQGLRIFTRKETKKKKMYIQYTSV